MSGGVYNGNKGRASGDRARSPEGIQSSAPSSWRLNRPAIPLLRMARHHSVGLLAAAFLTGCSLEGAPTYEFFGAYFPVWLLYGGMAVLLALLTRIVMIRSGVADQVAFPLLVCSSIGFMLAAALWALS